MSQEYREEVMFYMTMLFYDKFLQNKFIVMDEYYAVIQDIVDDYILNFDKTSKGLMESIEDYLKDKENDLIDLADNCTEDY